MTSGKPVVEIDIVSDIGCPWCFVGKRRLEQAIERLEDKAKFEIKWLPYQLDPSMPESGVPRQEYLKKKFGANESRLEMIHDYLAQTGVECGIDFCFRTNKKMEGVVVSNTFDAHRLMIFARETAPEKAGNLMTTLFKIFQEQGKNLAQRNVLLDAAESAGFDRKAADEFLSSEKGKKEIQEQDIQSKRQNISGVPHFTIKGSSSTLSEEEVNKLSVRQLKTKLQLRGVDSSQCVEKEELVKKVLETQHLEKPKKEVLSGAQEIDVFVNAIEKVLA